MKKFIYQFIRDPTEINSILDLIKLDLKNMQLTRNDKNSIRIYYQISETEKIYFDVFNQSKYAINERE